MLKKMAARENKCKSIKDNSIRATLFVDRGRGAAIDSTCDHMVPIQAACPFVCSKYKKMYGNIEES